jgi:peptidylprolyl isomerase
MRSPALTHRSVVAAAAALVLTLAGCGSGGGDETAGQTDDVSAWVEVQSRCNEAPRLAVDTQAEAPTELVIADICPGDGATVAEGAVVTAHYIGARLADGVPFDSSWDRGEPATFSLEQVIAGWGQGLPGMREGGRRILVIPADLGYGEAPPSGYPAGALIFVVDLEATQ